MATHLRLLPRLRVHEDILDPYIVMCFTSSSSRSRKFPPLSGSRSSIIAFTKATGLYTEPDESNLHLISDAVTAFGT
jgi:hypothetical protein